MKDEMKRKRKTEEKEYVNETKMNVSDHVTAKEESKCGKRAENGKGRDDNAGVVMLDDIIDEELGFLRTPNNTEKTQ